MKISVYIATLIINVLSHAFRIGDSSNATKITEKQEDNIERQILTGEIRTIKRGLWNCIMMVNNDEE